jgi:hypothetical protein
VHFSASEVQNIDALFFMLRCDRYECQKNHVGTRYADGVFLHPMGFTGPVVHFGASGVQNFDTLLIMLGWDRYGFHKNHVETRYAGRVFLASCGACMSRSAFRCIWHAKCRRTIFYARVEPVQITQKAHRDTLRRTCVFTCNGINGSHSAFCCVQGAKPRCTVFHAQMEPVRILQKVR